MRELTYLLRNNMQLRIILTFALQDHILQHKITSSVFCTTNVQRMPQSSAFLLLKSENREWVLAIYAITVM